MEILRRRAFGSKGAHFRGQIPFFLNPHTCLGPFLTEAEWSNPPSLHGNFSSVYLGV